MYVHWDATLETGQPLIDTEHRLLVFLFKKIDVAIKTQQSESVLRDAISETRRCVEFHFTSEENLMRETNYPGIAAHQAQHAQLIVELNILTTKVLSHREFPEDLLYFLNHWLVDHIAKHDQHVAQHIHTAITRPIAERAYSEFLPATLAPVTS